MRFRCGGGRSARRRRGSGQHRCRAAPRRSRECAGKRPVESLHAGRRHPPGVWRRAANGQRLAQQTARFSRQLLRRGMTPRSRRGTFMSPILAVWAWLGRAFISFAAIAADAGTGAPCAGFPRLDVQVRPGYCVARVADASLGLRFPRRIIEVEPGRYWVTDMGSWEVGQGRLLELSVAPDPTAVPRVQIRLLADALGWGRREWLRRPPRAAARLRLRGTAGARCRRHHGTRRWPSRH